MRRTDVYIREDQHDMLRQLADKETTTISYLIRKAIDQMSIPKHLTSAILEKEYKAAEASGEVIFKEPLVEKAVELAKEKGTPVNPVPKPVKKGK